MKKYILLSSFVFISSFVLFSQLPQYEWAQNIGSAGNDSVITSTTDIKGNLYIVGDYSGTSLKIDQTGNIPRLGKGKDLFIVKYNKSGQVIWYKTISCKTIRVDNTIKKLLVDSKENVYLLGETNADTIEINSTAHVIGTTSPGSNPFLFKYEEQTQKAALITIKIPYLTGDASIRDFIVDREENIIVTGDFKADKIKLDLSGKEIVGNRSSIGPKRTMFVIKYNNTTDVVWYKNNYAQASSNGDIRGEKICFDPRTNDIIVTGSFSDSTIYFDTKVNYVGNSDIYFVKYSKDALLIKSGTFTGLGMEFPDNIKTDIKGGVLLTGFYSSPVFRADTVKISSGNSNLQYFIAKLSSSLKTEWVVPIMINQLSGYNHTNVPKVKIDLLGNVYFALKVFSTSVADTNILLKNGLKIMLAKIKPSGIVEWKTFVDAGSDGNFYFDLDLSGNVIFASGYANTIDFGNNIEIASTGTGAFCSKYDMNGKPIVKMAIPSSNNEGFDPRSIVSDNLGNIYFTGMYKSATALLGNNSITSEGGSDIFISKITSKTVLKGTVVSGTDTIKYGYAKMYINRCGRQFLLFDSTEIYDGEYDFKDVPLGNFMICAYPDTSIYKDVVRGYLGNKAYWYEGRDKMFDIVGTTSSRPIDLNLPKMAELKGSSSLSGGITNNQLYSVDDNIIPALKSTLGRPVKDASVILRRQTKAGEIVAITYTDVNGYYEIPSVPIGAYEVIIDIPGLPVPETYLIDVTSDNSTITNMDYSVEDAVIVKSGSQTYLKNYFKSPSSNLNVFPNPSNGIVNVKMKNENPVDVKIEVVDNTGNTVFSEIFTKQSEFNQELNLIKLPKGMYVIKASAGAQMLINKLILK